MRGRTVNEILPPTVLLSLSWNFVLKTLLEAGIFLLLRNFIMQFS